MRSSGNQIIIKRNHVFHHLRYLIKTGYALVHYVHGIEKLITILATYSFYLHIHNDAVKIQDELLANNMNKAMGYRLTHTK